ncbi:hypothetical protein E1630_11630 [Salmonella enterica subsp. enterica serovar Baguida]|nr:hypothetical protein [Salmonella enterica subsp. enterica serovar Baguida]
MNASVDTTPISNEDALSRVKQAESNLLKAKERLDYLTRKTYLIQITINNKIYFLCDDDSLTEKFGGAIKFKRKCDANQELMFWLEKTECVGNPNVKSEIVVEKDLLRNFISHTKKQINKQPTFY